jgi:hypothetical protein
MPEKYTKEQLWKLYKDLPEELKEAVSSIENSEEIFKICQKNDIPADKISDVSKYVGHTLLGLLPPEEFSEKLEKDLGLKKESAKKAAQEISRFVFYPVKSALEDLYKTEFVPSAPSTEKGIKTEEKEEAPPHKDTYREPIE